MHTKRKLREKHTHTSLLKTYSILLLLYTSYNQKKWKKNLTKKKQQTLTPKYTHTLGDKTI